MKRLGIVVTLLLLTACGRDASCDDKRVLGTVGELADRQMEYLLSLVGVEDASAIRGAGKSFGPFVTKYSEGKTLACRAGLRYSIEGNIEEFILDYRVTTADDGNQYFVELVSME